MAVVCPTVTAYSLPEYRNQLEAIRPFARRIHLDFMDGEFAPTHSPGLGIVWRPHDIQTDLHIMYRRPMDHLDDIIRLNPDLVIAHAEAEGDFREFADRLHAAGIRAGTALLPETPAGIMRSALSYIDHVLVFSGNLGHFGGEADLSLLAKVAEVKALLPEVEIGWDGGINEQTAAELVRGGVDVLNVGGFIQNADDKEEAYGILKSLVEN